MPALSLLANRSSPYCLFIQARFVKQKLLKRKSCKFSNLLLIRSKLFALKDSCSDLFPLNASVARMQELMQELHQLINHTQAWTTSVEWKQVDLIGHHAHSDLSPFLNRNLESKRISAWDVSREFREAMSIASVADLDLLVSC
jgi:hypothetical protein